MFNAVEITKSIDLSFYNDFMLDADLSEFARSQVQFEPAVNAFPRALFYLGSLIEDIDIRLVVLDNINEEHGHGVPSKFHINTYRQYLKSIGSEYNEINNPWIQSWIKKWFSFSCPIKMAVYLSGIEFLYAPISDMLSSFLKTIPLKCEQTHYIRHSEIDWEHGQELLDLATQLNNDKYSIEELKTIFNDSQEDMIQVFNSMRVITQKTIKNIKSNPIAFYYLREDFTIPHSYIDNNTQNIVSIISGGESVISLMNMENKNIIGIDMNPMQLKVMEGKLLGDEKICIGKFEHLFNEFRNRFLLSDLESMNKDYIEFVCNDIFSRNVLMGVFGKDAVAYTKKDFSKHFYHVFISKFEEKSFGYKNILNVFFNNTMPIVDINIKSNIRTVVNNITVESINELFNEQLIDYIDLSNIGDWMPYDDFIVIMKAVYSKLETNGKVVVRKLLGDYNLIEIFEELGMKVIPFNDSTHFYTESVIAIK